MVPEGIKMLPEGIAMVTEDIKMVPKGTAMVTETEGYQNMSPA